MLPSSPPGAPNRTSSLASMTILGLGEWSSIREANFFLLSIWLVDDGGDEDGVHSQFLLVNCHPVVGWGGVKQKGRGRMVGGSKRSVQENKRKNEWVIRCAQIQQTNRNTNSSATHF